MTAVDGPSRCMVGWDVVWELTTDVMQAIVDKTPPVWFYLSDEFSTYDTLVYHPGLHQTLPNKSQPYAVEADNAELRHYLARLARHSIHALWRVVKLLVFAWNRRQLYKRAHPAILGRV